MIVLVCYLYVWAVQTTFRLGLYKTGIGPLSTIAITCLGGLVSRGLGYGSVITLGGIGSLRFADFIGRVTGSKYIIEKVAQRPHSKRQWILSQTSSLYILALLFTSSIVLAWDIYNIHLTSHTSINPLLLLQIIQFLHPMLHELDIFSKPINSDPLVHIINIIPPMVIITVATGLVIALAIPYFNKFKITGVNNRPFHTYLIYTVMGSIGVLGVTLTVYGKIYETLWVGQGPYYYHYIFPVMFGLSLHYTLGALLAKRKAGSNIEKRLAKNIGERVMKGPVEIQSLPTDDQEKGNVPG